MRRGSRAERHWHEAEGGRAGEWAIKAEDIQVRHEGKHGVLHLRNEYFAETGVKVIRTRKNGYAASARSWSSVGFPGTKSFGRAGYGTLVNGFWIGYQLGVQSRRISVRCVQKFMMVEARPKRDRRGDGRESMSVLSESRDFVGGERQFCESSSRLGRY